MNQPRAEEKEFPGQDLMTYSGYKFESVCTDNSDTAVAAAVVDATSEYSVLVRLKLQDLVVVMAAEVDLTRERPVSAGTPPPLESLLELKTFK
jgi:hypothetical protein